MKRRVSRRLAKLFKFINWHLIEKPGYIKTSVFFPPLDALDPNHKQMMSFYDSGVTFLDLDANLRKDCLDMLEPLKNDFDEAINIYDEMSIDEQITRVDKNNIEWFIDKERGIIEMNFEDRAHPRYSSILSAKRFQEKEKKRIQQINDLYNRYDEIKKVVEDTPLKSLANYGSDGNARPLLIKIERKTKSIREDPAHFDHWRGVFKAYLHLNDVQEDDGPIAISKGSHHWKLFPTMLEDIMVRKKKVFHEDGFDRYQLPSLDKIVCSAGSLFCFSGNAIHSATQVAPGRERWTIHFYYYSVPHWSTAKFR